VLIHCFVKLWTPKVTMTNPVTVKATTLRNMSAVCIPSQSESVSSPTHHTFIPLFQPGCMITGLKTTEKRPARKHATEYAKNILGACQTKSINRDGFGGLEPGSMKDSRILAICKSDMLPISSTSGRTDSCWVPINTLGIVSSIVAYHNAGPDQ
jgi:hypothetical protein